MRNGWNANWTHELRKNFFSKNDNKSLLLQGIVAIIKF